MGNRGKTNLNEGGVTTSAATREESQRTHLLDVVRRHSRAPELHGLGAGPEHAGQDRRQKRVGAHLQLSKDQTRLHTRLCRFRQTGASQPASQEYYMLAIGYFDGFAERCFGVDRKFTFTTAVH